MAWGRSLLGKNDANTFRPNHACLHFGNQARAACGIRIEDYGGRIARAAVGQPLTAFVAVRINVKCLPAEGPPEVNGVRIAVNTSVMDHGRSNL